MTAAMLRDLAYLWHLEREEAERRRDYDEGDRLAAEADRIERRAFAAAMSELEE